MNWGTVGADELSATLWRQRRQLDFLLFLLETQLLHLRAGNWHRLDFTASELEKVLENLRFESLARGVEASALAAEWNAPDQVNLPALIDLAPAGLWPELFSDHRREMVALLAGIDHAAEANTELLLAPPSAESADGDVGNLGLLTRDANIHRALSAVRAVSLRTLRTFLGLD